MAGSSGYMGLKLVVIGIAAQYELIAKVLLIKKQENNSCTSLLLIYMAVQLLEFFL